MRVSSFVVLLVAVKLIATAGPVTAQDRLHIPEAFPPFAGEIGRTYEESEPAWPSLPTPPPPEGAPNIVVVLLDDLGFGQPATFGGLIPTPALDALAARGIKYNRFHTTAICGPSRAALLTGRNHHDGDRTRLYPAALVHAGEIDTTGSDDEMSSMRAAFPEAPPGYAATA